MGIHVASAGHFSLPSDVEWFDEESRNEIQLAVKVGARSVDSLDAFDVIQTRKDAGAFVNPVEHEAIELNGRPAIKRTYITAASP